MGDTIDHMIYSVNSERLSAAIAAVGLSQAELGKRVGLSQGAIQQLQSGRTKMTGKLAAIGRELGVSPKWLSGETDDPTPQLFDEIDPAAARDWLGVKHLLEIHVLDIDAILGTAGDNWRPAWKNVDASIGHDLGLGPHPQLAFVKGFDDSMAPTLLDHDEVLVDVGHQVFDRQDCIWWLAYGGVGILRRVRILPTRTLMLIADNPSAPDFQIDISDVQVAGMVVRTARRYR